MEKLFNIYETLDGQWAGHWSYGPANKPTPADKKLVQENLSERVASKECERHNEELFGYVTE